MLEQIEVQQALTCVRRLLDEYRGLQDAERLLVVLGDLHASIAQADRSLQEIRAQVNELAAARDLMNEEARRVREEVERERAEFQREVAAEQERIAAIRRQHEDEDKALQAERNKLQADLKDLLHRLSIARRGPGEGGQGGWSPLTFRDENGEHAAQNHNEGNSGG